MTIAVWTVVVLLFGHWVADFVWQPHWMGMRKSKEWWVLIQHGARISVGGLAVGLVLIALTGLNHTDATPLAWWALVNGVAHVAIDAVTSRMTGKLYAKGDMHNFFVVIGFDQFLHVALAVLTLALLVL
jgi:hypothetical protein